MGQCTCGFTTDKEGECNGTHKAVRKLRADIAEKILNWHTLEDNTSPCCYNDCTHEEDAAIARGDINDN